MKNNKDEKAIEKAVENGEMRSTTVHLEVQGDILDMMDTLIEYGFFATRGEVVRAGLRSVIEAYISKNILNWKEMKEQEKRLAALLKE